MSTPTSGGPRRRKIAGERRPSRPAEVHTEPAAPEEKPAARTPGMKKRREDRAARPARPVRPARPSRSRGWLGSTRSLVTLGSLLAVLLVLVAALAFGWLGNDSVQEVRREAAAERAGRNAPATAERAAAAILAYDHRSLDADKENAVAFMTDEFAEEYTETFEKVVAPAAEQTRAVVTAEVQGSAVVRAGEEKVRVLLFVDQTTESTANPAPQLALNRVEMVLVRDGDSWLVDEITSY